VLKYALSASRKYFAGMDVLLHSAQRRILIPPSNVYAFLLTQLLLEETKIFFFFFAYFNPSQAFENRSEELGETSVQLYVHYLDTMLHSNDLLQYSTSLRKQIHSPDPIAHPRHSLSSA
jgi:hypothetical protein